MPANMFGFFWFVFRVLGIGRWGIMTQCAGKETLGEHSLEVARVSYKLVEAHNKLHNTHLSPATAAVFGIFHDVLEIFTGDLPTPVKQFDDGKMKKAADALEAVLLKLLLNYLPEKLSGFYEGAFTIPGNYKIFVKAADQISAYWKAETEVNHGNKEFKRVLVKFGELLGNSALSDIIQPILQEGPEKNGNSDMKFRVFVVTHALALIKFRHAETAAEEAAVTLFGNLSSPFAQAAVLIDFVIENRSCRESLIDNVIPEAQYFLRTFIPPGSEPITLDDLLGDGQDHLLGGAAC